MDAYGYLKSERNAARLASVPLQPLVAPFPGIHHQAAVHHVAVLLGYPTLRANSDLLALADGVSDFNHLRGQEVSLPLSRARISPESRSRPLTYPAGRCSNHGGAPLFPLNSLVRILRQFPNPSGIFSQGENLCG